MADNITCKLVRANSSHVGSHGITYFQGLSAESVGTTGICMHLLHIPPGVRAKAHMHVDHETAIYVISGEAGMWYGENLQDYLVSKTGDFLYIPAGMPHLPFNLSNNEPCIAIVARTDPNQEESIVLLPELEASVR